MNKLNIEDLSVVYHGKEKQVRAVDHVSFSVDAGDSLGIIGESGSGKSTMIHALLRLLPEKTGETQGRIWFDDTDLLTCDEKTLRKLRWKEIAVVFQRSMNSLSQIHTIGEQFEDVYRVHEPRAAKAQMKEIICGLFEKVNLNPRIYNMYPFELSGGMQQRLNIALSIMFSPALLIMDEATTALDVVTQGQILDELMEMEKTMSITRLMITHDLSVVATSCKKILVLYAGRLMEFGTVEDILKNPSTPTPRASSPPSRRSTAKRRPSSPSPASCRTCPRSAPGASSRPAAPTPTSAAMPSARRTWSWEASTGQPATAAKEEQMDNRQNALIEVEGLKKFYKNRGTGGLFKKKKMVQAVGGVSFEIRKGEIFGVIGESGCGKSTMGRTLVNLEAPTAGDVRINGESARAILQKDPKAFHQMVQMVFQNPFDTFLPTETIEQIMLRPLEINGLGGSEEERRKRIVQMLEDGGLSPAEDFLGRYPHELSGGQLQRISILRAMSVNPLFLVVDEPVSMLDVSVRADIINMLLDLTKKYQTSILFISHDIAVIRYVASRTAVMYLGRIVEMGDTDALIQHPMHPYTQALVSNCASIDIDSHVEKIHVEGEPPSPVDPGPGCYFADRCPRACEKCRQEYPQETRLPDGRVVACHLVNEGVIQ